MSRLLLDTHIVAWILLDSTRLDSQSREQIEAADIVSFSAISTYEISQKARIGKWPEMREYAAELPMTLGRAGLHSIPLSADMASLAANLEWSNSDPFDRLIAATSLVTETALLTMDRQFFSLNGLKLASRA